MPAKQRHGRSSAAVADSAAAQVRSASPRTRDTAHTYTFAAVQSTKRRRRVKLPAVVPTAAQAPVPLASAAPSAPRHSQRSQWMNRCHLDHIVMLKTQLSTLTWMILRLSNTLSRHVGAGANRARRTGPKAAPTPVPSLGSIIESVVSHAATVAAAAAATAAAAAAAALLAPATWTTSPVSSGVLR